MLDWHMYLLCGIAAYLLGAVPFGLIIARMHGVDIRRVGSGNIGATNVWRVLGRGWGALAFTCDALKGFLPAYLLPHLAGAEDNMCFVVVCACLAVIGHVWPVYLRFRGGKGVATGAGALLGMAPLAGGTGLLVWLIVFLVWRYVSLASVVAAAASALMAWLCYAERGLLLPGVLTLICMLTIWRHKGNIQRLRQGTEYRFQFRSGKKL